MKRPNLILLIIGLLLLIPVSIGITKTIEFEKTKVLTSYLYEGKVLMSQEDYTDFKSILALNNVNILELDVYSSDKPLAIFRVIAPINIPFPWGEQVDAFYEYTASESQQNLYIGFFTFALGTIAFAFLTGSFAFRKGN